MVVAGSGVVAAVLMIVAAVLIAVVAACIFCVVIAYASAAKLRAFGGLRLQRLTGSAIGNVLVAFISLNSREPRMNGRRPNV